METTSYIALSRQMALRHQMDVVANNIANMNTDGFKGEKMLFVQHLVRSKSSDNVLGEKLAYVRDVATVRDTTPGDLKSTGNPLDLAVSGDGYFTIQTAVGDRYTRNGRFQLDQTGQLVTQNGDPVLSDSGTPFFFGPTDTAITINGDGSVATENGLLGRLKIVRFDDNLKLREEGSTTLSTTPDNPPITADKAVVHQGMLESSNVQPIIELTHMIAVNRSYDNVQKFIQREDERERTMFQAINARS